jgi:hypothetical protein
MASDARLPVLHVPVEVAWRVAARDSPAVAELVRVATESVRGPVSPAQTTTCAQLAVEQGNLAVLETAVAEAGLPVSEAFVPPVVVQEKRAARATPAMVVAVAIRGRVRVSDRATFVLAEVHAPVELVHRSSS